MFPSRVLLYWYSLATTVTSIRTTTNVWLSFLLVVLTDRRVMKIRTRTIAIIICIVVMLMTIVIIVVIDAMIYVYIYIYTPYSESVGRAPQGLSAWLLPSTQGPLLLGSSCGLTVEIPQG